MNSVALDKTKLRVEATGHRVKNFRDQYDKEVEVALRVRDNPEEDEQIEDDELALETLTQKKKAEQEAVDLLASAGVDDEDNAADNQPEAQQEEIPSVHVEVDFQPPPGDSQDQGAGQSAPPPPTGTATGTDAESFNTAQTHATAETEPGQGDKETGKSSRGGKSSPRGRGRGRAQSRTRF